MARRINFEKVKYSFKERGYKLLEEEYINAKTKMKFKCGKHPDKELSITWSDFNNGTGCKYCGIENRANKRRNKHEDVERFFESKGYKLLDKYKTNRKNMKVHCSVHPDEETYISYMSLKKGNKPSCCKTNAKFTFEQAKSMFNDKGLVLLEDEYIDRFTKMKYKCNKHPDVINKSTLSNLKASKYACPECDKERKRKRMLGNSIGPIGEKHHNWKGGISSINDHLRKLIKDWKKEKLIENNFRCFITNEHHHDLEVHHIIPFYKIRDEVFEELGLEFKEIVNEYPKNVFEMIVKSFTEKHNKYNGYPLRKDIHKLFHHLYGYDVDENDFFDFKQKYLNDDINEKKVI